MLQHAACRAVWCITTHASCCTSATPAPAAPEPQPTHALTRLLQPLFPVQQDQRQQQQAGSKAELGWRELFTAAKLAQWSGLCYLHAAELQAALQGQPMSLVAQGRSRSTSW
jgi:hypothetical protein